MKKHYLIILLTCIVYAQAQAVVTYESIHSQSVDLARQYVGVLGIMEDLRCSEDCWPGFISGVLEYTESFNPKNISRQLFGLTDCQSITVSGSAVASRGATDWLADNFGLPVNYQSTLNFNPHISNVIGDIQGYLRLSRWCKKLYLYIHAPIVHTKWNLNVCEDVQTSTATGYAAGYFSPAAVDGGSLSPSASAFLSGQFAPTIAGVTFNKLSNARWAVGDCGSLTKTELADLRMWLGYDWINRACYDLGLGLVVAAPTGNRPEGNFLFEPIAGNGKHWEIGLMVNGTYTPWENCDGTHRVQLFTQANITHLCKAKQRRTFDLVGKPLSRYMLAEQMGPNTTVLFANPTAGSEDPATTTAPSNQFAGVYTSVANLTTLCVDVSTNVQIDWLAMATYSRCNFSWDVGYELWYRGCEKIKPRDCGDLITANTWALKGDAYTYGFAGETVGSITQGTAIPLSATESAATIYAGTNGGSNVNTGVDNSQFALFGATTADLGAVVVSPTSALVQQKTSNEPLFISSDSIDFCSARTRGLSNKVFTHVNYYWDCECLQPFVGFGGMAEFGSRNSGSSCSTNSNCERCAISQWGVWIKGGFVFG